MSNDAANYAALEAEALSWERAELRELNYCQAASEEAKSEPAEKTDADLEAEALGWERAERYDWC